MSFAKVCLAAFAAIALSAIEAAAQKAELKLGHIGEPGSLYAQTAEEFAKRANAKLGDKDMVLMALATIRAETGNFTPLSEYRSKFNTSPGGHAFNLYDNRKDLGNTGRPDGERYRGRGYVQLTGRTNYQVHGNDIGLNNQLVEQPQLANDPTIAAKLLASFLKSKEVQIRAALRVGDLKTARRLVNGGSHGLDAFSRAFKTGQVIFK
jgi:peptidoglycan L-alanyl-D-glutamate endopeptidase CwlK